MKIALDGGALCQNDYTGNKVFSENLIKALGRYDKENYYYVYSYCNKKFYFAKNIIFKKLFPKFGWSKIRLSIEQLIFPTDIFLSLNQSIPIISSKKIISFCHGLSYFYYPKLYSDSYFQLKSQLTSMIKKSNYILVSSKKVKKELLSIFEKINRQVLVFPFGVPFDIKNNLNKKKRRKIFLFVGVNHPIKNINFIKTAFNIFKKDKKFKDWQLILVTKNLSRKKLKNLYQSVTCLLTASLYESFNFPVLEALVSGCQVIGLKSAIIPEFYPYVKLANNLDDFIENMKIIAKKNEPVSFEKIKEIKKIFSWKNYVFKLIKLF